MNPHDGPYELPRHIMQMVEDGAPDFLFMDADDRLKAWANRPVQQATFIDHNIEKQMKIRAAQVVLDKSQVKPIRPKTGGKSVKTDRRGQCWNPRTGRWESLVQPLHGSVAIMAKLLILPLDKGMQVIARGKTSLAPGATVNEIADKVGYAAGRAGRNVAFVWVTTEDQPDRPALAEWHLVNDKLICVSPPSVQLPPAPEPGHESVDNTNGKEADMAKKEKATKKKINGNGNTGRKPGVIHAIVEAISRKNGASLSELVEILTKKFPERRPESMTSTAKIQANRNATSKEKSETRGLVYYREA
jgi:hypothetical protein